ncbi:MAG: hypothetical protein M1829_000535 [Trizodia sp. TS-e1964]|nr:MAG: hypothetical protein M1829_000535 [Trizodia sp. TS-e1964]
MSTHDAPLQNGLSEINGEESIKGPGTSSAALELMEKHTAQDHHANIEETADEDSIAHPPLSDNSRSNEASGVSSPPDATGSWAQPISAKAAGKQRAQEVPNNQAPGRNGGLDIQSDELFPGLGPPKTQSTRPVASIWGAKGAPAVPMGTNGKNLATPSGSPSGPSKPPKSNASSRSSTPASGVRTPAPGAASTRAPKMSMPGKFSESIKLDQSQMIPQEKLKKPMQEIIRDINKSSKATIQMTAAPGGAICFEGKGPADAVRLALREVGKQISINGSVKLPNPASARTNMLHERTKKPDDNIVRTIEVDKKHHKALIGIRGSAIRDIVVSAGGPDDQKELARMVRFPRQDSDEAMVRVEGSKAVVDKIISSLEDIIKQREDQVADVLQVAPEKHRFLIGRSGETRKNIESTFAVSVEIPKQSAADEERATIRIVGMPANVEKAKAHITSIIKDQEGETIQVPRRVHHLITDHGQIFRRLKADHKVTVDHNGQKPPARPTGFSPRTRVNEGQLPLISDEGDSSSNYSWEIHNLNDSPESGDIPWILHGPSEGVAKARAILEKSISQAQKDSTTGYLILPDPKTYRFVVGRGGSQVNSIRNDTGCKITVPRDQAAGEAIEIRGSEQGVNEAKNIILELVRSGGKR